jgi:hypothetical protein
MKVVALIFGVICVLLGSLWLLQGLNLVHIEPVACVAECETIEEFSPLWAIIGFVVVAVGALALRYGLKRHPQI